MHTPRQAGHARSPAEQRWAEEVESAELTLGRLGHPIRMLTSTGVSPNTPQSLVFNMPRYMKLPALPDPTRSNVLGDLHNKACRTLFGQVFLDPLLPFEGRLGNAGCPPRTQRGIESLLALGTSGFPTGCGPPQSSIDCRISQR